jgi:hypothetical protein
MVPQLAPLAGILDLSSDLLPNCLDGLDKPAMSYGRGSSRGATAGAA